MNIIDKLQENHNKNQTSEVSVFNMNSANQRTIRKSVLRFFREIEGITNVMGLSIDDPSNSELEKEKLRLFLNALDDVRDIIGKVSQETTLIWATH
jgi:ssRNA-specific RNase YbeY (16S rRNA maturation enzyme)